MLARVAAAPARATVVHASRAEERDELAEDDGGASGLRAAVAPERQQVGMPLDAGRYRITSHYGYRVGPLGGGSQFHTGVDLAAPLGTPIHVVADGVVTYVGAGKDGRSSMLVIVEHEIDDRTYYTWYNHMYASDLYVSVGQQVSVGDVIAGVGNNGNSTGPHLHFEVHVDDELTTTEPLAWLEEMSTP
ncbi:peptidoglycan DD-metalloendopeptidase family protein [Georgenia subflava]|uniref:Peptidoglycan DD-metalloendopeptidase family protein n=1 Tax=Georgenia subflava TaxID=1622177 RepID=A0A6N7EHL0_9MICO|nr:M23 family metallopeptidase [Georgenia subflava]MPV37872.1 peptidoglycan DD-metalloendopeptidase family protein [Georgenia subflava]